MSVTDTISNPCPQDRNPPCETRPFEHSSDLNNEDEIKRRPLLYAGVLWIGVLRKFLIPKGECEQRAGSLRPINTSSSVHDKRSSLLTPDTPPPNRHQLLRSDSGMEQLLRGNSDMRQLGRSETDREHMRRNETDREQMKRNATDRDQRRKPVTEKPSSLASLVYQIQDVSAVVAEEAKQLSCELNELVHDGKTITSETVKSMRKEDAVGERCCAVAGSGLAGYLAGLRRGPITRLVYSITGAIAMATVCCPEEALRYNREALESVHHVVEMAVNLFSPGPDKKSTVGLKEPSDREKLTCSHQSSSSTIGRPKELIKQVIPVTEDKKSEKETKVYLQDNSQMHVGFGKEINSNATEQSVNDLKQYETRSSALHETENVQNIPKGKLVQECGDHLNILPYSPALPVPPMVSPFLKKSLPENNNSPQFPISPKMSSSSENMASRNVSGSLEKSEIQMVTHSTEPYTPAINIFPEQSSTHKITADSPRKILPTMGYNATEDLESPTTLYSSTQLKAGTNHYARSSKTQPNLPTSTESRSELPITMFFQKPGKDSDPDSSQRETVDRSQFYPLNKKLSNYYVEIKERTASSQDVTEDYTYSNE